MGVVSCQISCQVHPKEEYVKQLQASKKMWQLSSGSHYILGDCETSTGGLVADKYVCVHREHTFVSGEQSVTLLRCSCPAGILQGQRLQMTNRTVQGPLCNFIVREESQYCLHSYAVNVLFRVDIPRVPITFEHLQDVPLLVAVHLDEPHLVHLKNTSTGKKLACMTCTYGTKDCQSVEEYKAWLRENEKDSPETGKEGPRISHFNFITYRPIPYPLTAELKEVYDQQESGQRPFPKYLSPTIPTDDKFNTCKHGYPWNAEDPITNGWIVGSATIYKESCTITHVNDHGTQEEIKLCYRPSMGGCSCQLFYDGREDLLFNLNNKDLIHYRMLQSYLHLMMEARNPLAAFHRAYACTNASMSSSKQLPLHKLRLAWNGYIRCLEMDWKESFQCNVCGDDPEVIVCDGTAIGLHKQLLPGQDEDVSNLPLIDGSKHEDRVFIPSPKARKLLLQFAGANPQSKGKSSLPPVPLSREQYLQMTSLLRKFNHLHSLVDVIERVSNHGNDLSAPSEYRPFLQDLSRNTPASALLQLCEHSDARNILNEIIIDGLNVFQSQNHVKLTILRSEAPIFLNFIEAVSIAGIIHNDVCHLLKDVLARCKSPEPTINHYSEAQPKDLFQGTSFFPNMPQRHGNGNYSINTKQENRACSSSEVALYTNVVFIN